VDSIVLTVTAKDTESGLIWQVVTTLLPNFS